MLIHCFDKSAVLQTFGSHLVKVPSMINDLSSNEILTWFTETMPFCGATLKFNLKMVGYPHSSHTTVAPEVTSCLAGQLGNTTAAFFLPLAYLVSESQSLGRKLPAQFQLDFSVSYDQRRWHFQE